MPWPDGKQIRVLFLFHRCKHCLRFCDFYVLTFLFVLPFLFLKNVGNITCGCWIQNSNVKRFRNNSNAIIFGRPFVKRFALCYRSVVCLSCLSVCPVCDLRALWPNGWTDQDETWHADRPRHWPHCVRWRPSCPSPKGAQPPNFRPISVSAKWLHGSICHLVWR